MQAEILPDESPTLVADAIAQQRSIPERYKRWSFRARDEHGTLVATGSTGSLSWLTDLSDVTYTEFRDDRFVAAFTDQAAKLAYIVRAVAPGHYTLPGATIEDMYRPERNATLATTAMSVMDK